MDQRAFTEVFKAAFEAVVGKKPDEEVNARLGTPLIKK